MTRSDPCPDCGGKLRDDGFCSKCLTGPGFTEERTATGGASSPATAPLPSSIGDYRILSKLGEGGMGVVYKAEQQSPRRTVALKVVRGGEFVDDSRVRMFQREADTLARLQHPSIAAIHESGRTEDGRHFFVMELVQGTTLDAYLRGRPAVVTGEELGLRLGLFRKIVDAVHYAHQRGVIHRDLKPSNLIVSQEPSRLPEIKILDFGLARITEGDIAAATMTTEVGVIKGTLPYMSPEQTRGDPAQIDLRSDVYALGVILYEMLAGRRPYEVMRKSLVEAVRVICEEPPRPLRQPWSGVRRLDADLETIVGKALEKEADRRYASAAAMSEDIERYLTSQPISARPPSTLYQLRKFAERNRALVGGVTATFLVLVAGILVSTVLGLREASQRKEAEKAKSNLESVVAFQAEMLSDVDPYRMGSWLFGDLQKRVARAARAGGASDQEVEALVASFTASMRGVNTTNTALELIDRNVLRRALEMLGERFGAQPLVDAHLRGTIGRTYRKLGMYELAEPHSRRALETRRRLLGNEHPDTLASLSDLANLFMEQGRYENAEPLFVEGLETTRRTLGNDHPSTLEAIRGLASLYFFQRRYEVAEPLFVEALERRRRVLGSDDPKTLQSMTGLGLLYRRQNRNSQAESLLLETLETARRALGEEAFQTAMAMHNVAIFYSAEGRYDQAEALLREAFQTHSRVLGDDHPDTLNSMNSLAFLHIEQDRYDQAEALLREALERGKRALGDDNPRTLLLLNNLAGLYRITGRYDDAEPLYLESLKARKRVLGDRHPAQSDGGVGMTLYRLACLEAQRGDRAKAMGWLRQSVESGYGDASSISQDPELASLRGDPEFEAIVAELENRSTVE